MLVLMIKIVFIPTNHHARRVRQESFHQQDLYQKQPAPQAVVLGSQDRTADRAWRVSLANTKVLKDQHPVLLVHLMHRPFQVVPNNSWTASAMPGTQTDGTITIWVYRQVVSVQSVQLEHTKALEVLSVIPVEQAGLHQKDLYQKQPV